MEPTEHATAAPETIPGNNPPDSWQPITTAPRHGWFLAYAGSGYPGPTRCRVAVIHRVEGVGFGPWEGSEEAYYKADFFTHWMPLPERPAT